MTTADHSSANGADEHLNGVGAELKQARIQRGRSIVQAHQATRIPRPYLEALESEDWPALPAAPFARGFIASYAQYLGLDPNAVLDRCPFPPSTPGESLQPQTSTAQAQQAVQRSAQRQDQLQPPRVHLGPWLAAAVVVLVIIAGVVAVVSLREEVEPVEPTRAIPGISQVPETASSSAATTTSSDFAPLPDLTQLSEREALNHIRQLDAPYVVITIYDDSPAGLVIEQSPAPGAEPAEDAVITLVVSRGPRPSSAAGATSTTGS